MTPVIGFLGPTSLDEVSNRIPPASPSQVPSQTNYGYSGQGPKQNSMVPAPALGRLYYSTILYYTILYYIIQ